MDKKELIYQSPKMDTLELALRKVIALSGGNNEMQIDEKEDWDD